MRHGSTSDGDPDMRKFFKFLAFASLWIGTTTFADVASAASCRDSLGTSRTVTLSTYGGVRYGSSHGGHKEFLGPKEVVLTFDDGPAPGPTSKVLHELKKHCAKATFFMVGRMAKNHPEMVRKIVSAGHTVGAHSDSHRNLGNTDGKTAIQDVDRSIRAIHKAAGRKTSPFFRFPYLSENRTVNTYLKKRDYGVFAVDVDSKDYRFGNASAMVNRVMSELRRKGKGIILLHDIKKVTANGLGQLLNRLHAEGYKLVHIRGRGGREISDPIVMASLQDTSVAPSKPKTQTRKSAIKRETPKKTKVATVKRSKKTVKKKSAEDAKPSISVRQREIIKKRQLAFLQKAKKRRQSFRDEIKKRLILQ